MGRLKSLNPGPARLAPLLGAKDRAEALRARDRRRAQDAGRKMYQTKAWQDLRQEILERDGWVCQATGVYLIPGRTAPNAAVVDHIQPHRGDPKLFFDRDNLRSVSKAWHDSEKQSAEKAEATAARRPGGWVRF